MARGKVSVHVLRRKAQHGVHLLVAQDLERYPLDKIRILVLLMKWNKNKAITMITRALALKLLVIFICF